jgi:hypothetical protein
LQVATVRRRFVSHHLFAVPAFILLYVGCVAALADTLSFAGEDFLLTPVLNDVTAFFLSVQLDGPSAQGSSMNLALTGLQYSVLGGLNEDTPSEFCGFDLQRTIDGADVYTQGSSPSFIVADSADLSDGLQITGVGGIQVRWAGN